MKRLPISERRAAARAPITPAETAANYQFPQRKKSAGA